MVQQQTVRDVVSRQCVVGIYDSFETAREAIHALDVSHLPSEQVSLVMHHVDAEVPREEELEYGDKTEKSAVTGAGLGGLLGFLLGSPLLIIPGVGPLLLAGPVATGLTGAIVGGFLGAMTGWGIHEDHVQQYEEQVRQGKVLVVVDGDPLEVADAKRILDASQALEVHLHAETGNDSPEIDDRPLR